MSLADKRLHTHTYSFHHIYELVAGCYPSMQDWWGLAVCLLSGMCLTPEFGLHALPICLADLLSSRDRTKDVCVCVCVLLLTNTGFNLAKQHLYPERFLCAHTRTKALM